MKILQFCCIYLAVLLAVPAAAFDFQTVVAKAKLLAANSYQEPPSIPKFLKELSYDEYQNIRFIPEKSLWRESDSRFQVMIISPGLFYGHAVTINIVDADGSHILPFHRNYFSYADPKGVGNY